MRALGLAQFGSVLLHALPAAGHGLFAGAGYI
jgi:hypothetical protein